MFKIKNNFILLEAFATVFTVSMYFTDNPRRSKIVTAFLITN